MSEEKVEDTAGDPVSEEQLKHKVDNLVDSINSRKVQRNAEPTLKLQVQQIIDYAERLNIDRLDVREVIDTSFANRNVTDPTRYVRKILPEKYKYMNQARTKKRNSGVQQVQKLPDQNLPTDYLQIINELQTEIQRLRQENEIVGNPFIAKGFISVDGENVPVIVTVNPHTKLLEGELDHETIKQMVKEHYKTLKDREEYSRRLRK